MNGVRRWFRLGDVERDVDEEIALYFEEMVRDLVAAGQSEESARAEAARRFGDARAYRSQLVTIDRRVARRLRWRARVGAVRDTVVHAGRSVARTPALALGVVIAFALGIGANATMYATVERLLLRPPPHISNPDGVRRLMVERETGFAGRITTVGITFPDYIDFTRAIDSSQYQPRESTHSVPWSRSAVVMNGRNTSTGARSMPVKPRGVTPMIVNGP
jgi:tetrahydromethanopterin S-methyltransferase subunit F